MTRRRARTTRNRVQGTNRLIHPANVPADPGAVTDVDGSKFSIINIRPARPRMVEVQYSSLEPHSFVITVFSFNDSNEEVYRSKTLLSGPIPRIVRFAVPISTDFAIASSTNPVLRFNHSSVSNLKFSINLHVEYKFQIPTSFF
jgi:hypothetical protein